MNLDIHLFQFAKKNMHEVGFFCKVNALLNWIDNNIMTVECNVHIEITKENLQKLLSDLNRLNVNNCTEVFPTIEDFVYGFTEYDACYWESVNQIRHWANELMASFDFEQNTLYFHAQW